jgi:hypothetical protein
VRVALLVPPVSALGPAPLASPLAVEARTADADAESEPESEPDARVADEDAAPKG